MNREELTKFDAYYTGELSSEESAELKRALEADDQLAQRYDTFLTAMQAIALEGISKDIRSKHEASHSVRNVRYGRTGQFFVFLVISVLIGLAIWWFSMSHNQSVGSDIMASFKPYEDNITLRSEDGSAHEVMDYYNVGDYKKYIALVDVEKEMDSKLIFYLGQSYLAINEPTLSLDALGRLPNNSYYDNLVPWFRIVAYSQMGMDDGSLLDSIRGVPDHVYNGLVMQSILEQRE